MNIFDPSDPNYSYPEHVADLVLSLRNRGYKVSPVQVGSNIKQGILTADEYELKVFGATPNSKPVSTPEKKAVAGEEITIKGLKVAIQHDGTGGELEGLTKAIASHLEGSFDLVFNVPVVEQPIDKAMVEALVQAEANRIAQAVSTLTINIPGQQPVTVNGAHKQLKQVIQALSLEKHVYLYSAPGSGKTTVAYQAAQALQREFGYSMLGAGTMPSHLFGYTTPDGSRYVETPLSELFTKSAVMCWDEMDNCQANTLTMANGALENLAPVPFGTDMRVRHPEFRVIGTGNTAAMGGNIQHAERRALDAATRERFIFIEFEYDEALEERMVQGVAPVNASDVINWWRGVRVFVNKNAQKLVVSPRGARDFALMVEHADTFSVDDCLNGTLWKGCAEEMRKNILTNVPLPAFKRP